MSKKKISPEAQAIISASDAGWTATTVVLAEKFLLTHTDSQRAWLDLGHALGQLARYDDARNAFQKAMEIAADGPQDVIFGELGNLCRTQGDFDAAAQWYRKQIASDPTDATGHLFLGNLMFQQGNFAEAEAILIDGLKCQQGCQEEIHYSIGVLKRAMGQLQASKKHFESAIDLDDKYVAAKIGLKDVKTAISLS